MDNLDKIEDLKAIDVFDKADLEDQHSMLHSRQHSLKENLRIYSPYVLSITLVLLLIYSTLTASRYFEVLKLHNSNIKICVNLLQNNLMNLNSPFILDFAQTKDKKFLQKNLNPKYLISNCSELISAQASQHSFIKTPPSHFKELSELSFKPTRTGSVYRLTNFRSLRRFFSLNPNFKLPDPQPSLPFFLSKSNLILTIFHFYCFPDLTLLDHSSPSTDPNIHIKQLSSILRLLTQNPSSLLPQLKLKLFPSPKQEEEGKSEKLLGTYLKPFIAEKIKNFLKTEKFGITSKFQNFNYSTNINKFNERTKNYSTLLTHYKELFNDKTIYNEDSTEDEIKLKYNNLISLKFIYNALNQFLGASLNLTLKKFKILFIFHKIDTKLILTEFLNKINSTDNSEDAYLSEIDLPHDSPDLKTASIDKVKTFLFKYRNSFYAPSASTKVGPFELAGFDTSFNKDSDKYLNSLKEIESNILNDANLNSWSLLRSFPVGFSFSKEIELERVNKGEFKMELEKMIKFEKLRKVVKMCLDPSLNDGADEKKVGTRLNEEIEDLIKEEILGMVGMVLEEEKLELGGWVKFGEKDVGKDLEEFFGKVGRMVGETDGEFKRGVEELSKMVEVSK